MWYDSSRMTIASMLGNWGHLSSLPILRTALRATWEWEQRLLASLEDSNELTMLLPYQAYQYDVAYALGQLGAIGALTGIPFSASRQRILMIYLVLGSRHLDKHLDLFDQLLLETTFKQEVAEGLKRLFGLSEAEQEDCIKHFGSDYFREGAVNTTPLHITWEDEVQTHETDDTGMA